MFFLVVSSEDPREECSLNLNVGDILKRSVQKSEQSSVAVHQIGCVCHSPARMSFCRAENFTANDVILYLTIFRHCRVTGADLAVWGRAADLRVLYLMDDVILQDNGETKDDLQGLFNIGTLTLRNLKNKTIPRMFLSYIWEKMAEIQLSKIRLGSTVNILKTTMPYLQSLELSGNDLRALPDFPWCNRSLKLPRKLSRTFTMNAYYSQGATINPHVYRRFYAVHFNPGIRDFKIPSGSLDKISIRGDNLKSIDSTMFHGVTGLKVIDLSLNKLSHIPERIFEKTPDVVSVNFANNNLTWLDGKTFENLTNLRKLDAGHNYIHTIQNGFLSDKLVNLEAIEFENNLLRVIEARAFPRSVLNALKKINLRKNKLREVPQFGFYVRNLKTYDISENGIDFAGFVRTVDRIFMPDFLYVHTNSGSSIDTPINFRNEKILNLERNAIERFDLTEFNKTRLITLEFILKVFTISLTGNPLHCDCKTRELQIKLLNWTKGNTEITEKDFESWVCHTPPELRGMKILNVPSKDLRCERRCGKCPKRCTCYRSDSDSVTLVDCRRRNLTMLPSILPNGMVELRLEYNQIENLTFSKNTENVTSLYASHNKLQRVSLTLKHFPSKLNEIYLDSNKLTTLPNGFRNFTLSRINLQNNFFTCGCENRWMKSWLKQQSKAFVGGAESVACSSGGMNQAKPLVSVKDTDFVCTETVKPNGYNVNEIKAISAYVLAGFLFTLLVMVALIYRFRKELKLVLYTRFDWHPFDRVDDSDPSKVYDAFVSFNMCDKRWVMETLQNKLENHHPSYKLCIHYRDFIPGAPIAETILESVKKSRRMIMVLSRNFIQSEWCMLEFRAAHRRVLKGRTNYLIIVLFDDVNVDSLDDELKLYLKTNTYLSVQSKWFWQQLKYALPQKKQETSDGFLGNQALDSDEKYIQA
ncbi:toll-like [Paramuricea clavata]|uniref:Toll-like n=1 Tax=Paramuricea clavata TaxID=317549 RepID=A0A6S7IF51_PARCT|nr:toll-like [Paramuricea clavata]